jgi:dihydropteroate synthase
MSIIGLNDIEHRTSNMICWQLRTQALTIGERPLVMGILNVTPDSFSDGGRFNTAEKAVVHGLEMVNQGADLLDVGGESTRPGAKPVDLGVELGRVVPVVEALVQQTSVPISVDTSKAEVARQCLKHGAQIINDVTALAGDPQMTAVVREFDAGIVLMHMQGTPATMQRDPRYKDVVAEVLRFLRGQLKACVKAGLAVERMVVDPGIGFGKTVEHNLTLLARLEEFQKLNRPVLLGVSRKGFSGTVLGRSPSDRMAGSLAIVSYAIARGAVQIVRVHDVAQTRDAVTMCGKILEFRKRGLKH